MSIKSTFLANWMIWKTYPNCEVIHGLEIAKQFQKSVYNTYLTSINFWNKFQKVKNLGQLKIIGLTITRTNVKKTCGFCMQRIMLVLNQIKGDIKENIWWCHQHIVQKYRIKHILVSSKLLFLIIYCFKVCLSFK